MGLYTNSAIPNAAPTLIDPLTAHIMRNPIRVLITRYEMVLAMCLFLSTIILHMVKQLELYPILPNPCLYLNSLLMILISQDSEDHYRL